MFYRHPIRVPELFDDARPVSAGYLPNEAGSLKLIRLSPANKASTTLSPFIAELRVPGHELEPIRMYFLTIQPTAGQVVSRSTLSEDCEGLPVAALFRDLCPKRDCKTEVLFEQGGILEFCYMVSPVELNGTGLWKQAAATVIQEIERFQQPAILVLKAHPMELSTIQALPDWASARVKALKLLYARSLGVTDLGADNWMWRPLGKGKKFSIKAASLNSYSKK